MVKKSNGKEGKETRKKKSYKVLWHFPSKNSKDSFHILDPEFLKS